MGFLGRYLPGEGGNLKSNFLKNFIKRLGEGCSRRIKGKREPLWPAVPAMCKEQNELHYPITRAEGSAEFRTLTPHPLCTPHTHCPSCNWVCVPAEFQANLRKHVKTWYENAGRGVEEREKECALPCKRCRALHCTFDPQCLPVWVTGSRPEGLCRNEYPTGSAHKCNTVGILCTWEECLLSMINERITITQLRIHGTGIVWGTLRNAASRQESMDCSLKAIYTTR